jgi:hypothetical protein
VAAKGAELADKMNRVDRQYDANEKAVSLANSKRVRDKKELPAANVEYEKARKASADMRRESEAFEKAHGLSVVDAWQAHDNEFWPHYRIYGAGDRQIKHVRASKAK